MSSDSSEDEDLEKFREAADSQFINDDMFRQKEAKQHTAVKKTKLPSLRQTKDEDEQFNLFRVSPEFQSYVAKHLSKILDKTIKETLKTLPDINPKRRKSGIKLFRNSPHFLKIKETTQITQKRKTPKSDSEDEEKLRSAAISPDDILTRKETKHWSNRSKAPVFTYIKTKHGLVLK